MPGKLVFGDQYKEFFKFRRPFEILVF